MKLKVLFYISKNGSNIEYITEFLKYLICFDGLDILILFDSEKNYNNMISINKDLKLHVKFLIKDEVFLLDSENIRSIFNDYKIELFLFFNGQMTVSRSKPLVEIYKYTQYKNIKFYWINRMFLKDRYCIYSDIYFNNLDIDLSYKSTTYQKIDENRKIELNKYIEKYWIFKDSIHENLFKKIESTIKFSLLEVLRKLKQFKNKNNKIYNDKIEDNKPYVLLLLPKENHWFNTYANKDFLNLEKIVQYCHSVVSAHGLNLIVKRHPRERSIEFSNDILKNKILIYEGDLSQAVKNSEIVIFTGTTSGLESLLLGKKVIQLGKYSSLPLKSEKNLPLNIVEKLSDLKKEFNQVFLKQNFDKYKLIILLDAIFKNSNHFNNSEEDNDYQIHTTRPIENMKDVALFLKNQISRDFTE